MAKMAINGRAIENAITGRAETGPEVKSTKNAPGQSPKRNGHAQVEAFTAMVSGHAVCAAPTAIRSAASVTSRGRSTAGQGRGNAPARGLCPLSPVCQAAV